ncbi:hypothetical protein [Bacillus thermotolerans]|uniref:hypothetical protein n=1 Tax=Bacillus thermotolerans TaxID=1221996 RepID=UPI00057D8221|nr:hypothetical protein [Bacillus thermotolerans]KKB37798.1 hypothetical protein QY97_03703 [Bacillus thermotolerans]
MRSERHRGHRENRDEEGDVHQQRDHHSRRRGAKTFRRGRAIAFLERMNLKRSTLKKQLETPELQSIHPVLVGELKAIDMVISEFVQLFELHEFEEEAKGKENEEKEASLLDSEDDHN